MINKNLVKKIDKETIERYNNRLKKFGPEVRTLGWNTEYNQQKRFESATSLINLKGKSIVDIGCGFGDFLKFIKERKIKTSSFRGIDINEDLLKVARKRYPGIIFENRNILIDLPKKKVADIGFALGVLNFNLKNKPNNYKYAVEFIKSAFTLCKEALVVDMLSNYLDKDYPKEDFVFYYSPERMFKEAKKISPYVILKHDYPPLPQNEFLLILKRKPCP